MRNAEITAALGVGLLSPPAEGFPVSLSTT